MVPNVTPLDYLEHSRTVPNENLFIVGQYERNITLYRQQMRALNLSYALASRDGEACEGVRIAIAGAGAFGTTAAVALAWLGYEVKLFEMRDTIIPLQRGCDTRWISPRYYEWPSPGSETKFAQLPFMSWQSATASQVAEQLEKEFEKHLNSCRNLFVYRNMKNFQYDKDNDSNYVVKGKYINDALSGQIEWRCQNLIFCGGFGPESTLGSRTSSYWRNDNYGQLDLDVRFGQTKSFLVSGVGDGGITDVARLTMSNFRHERVFSELFGDVSQACLQDLRKIQSDWQLVEENERPKDWLFLRFETLATADLLSGAFGKITQKLIERRRLDTNVILNARRTFFCDTLSLDQTSLCNALLIFLMHRIGAFSYEEGELKHSNGAWTLRRSGGQTQTISAKTEVVVRHGTDRSAPLKDFKLSGAINALQALSKPAFNTADRIFPAGWWDRNKRRSKLSSDGTEFLSPATELLASTFISSVAGVIKDIAGKKDYSLETDFRLTLHRVTSFSGKEYFQQLSPYKGSVTISEAGGKGRIFPIEGGLVGLAIRYGLPFVFRRHSKDLSTLRQRTSFDQLLARPIADDVESMIACPFFSSSHAAHNSKVILVLFGDTSIKDLFSEACLGTLYAAMKSFVEHLDKSIESGSIKEVSGDFCGHEIDLEIDELAKDTLMSVGVTFDNRVFKDCRSELTFSKLTRVDLEI